MKPLYEDQFQDEDTGISYHGVAYIETAPLLYPGGLSHT